MQHAQNAVLMNVQRLLNTLADFVLHVDTMNRRKTMCVKTDLQDHGTRLSALESKHNTPADIAAVQAKLAMIETYLFGAGGVPDVPRDKSNIKVVKS